MHKWRVFIALLAGAVVYLVPATILLLPYGIAEPGGPDDAGGLFVLWSVLEWLPTLWVFQSRRKAGEPDANKRWAAAGIILGGAFFGAALGLFLMSAAVGGENEFEVGSKTAAFLAIAAHWIGRWRLRQAARDAASPAPRRTRVAQ